MKVNVLNSGNLRVNKPEKISYYIEAYISLGGKKHTQKKHDEIFENYDLPWSSISTRRRIQPESATSAFSRDA